MRSAHLCGQRIHGFSTLRFGPQQLWTRDLDLLAPEDVVATMAMGNAVPLEVANLSTFRHLEGVHFSKLRDDDGTFAIRPIGVFHRTRQVHGQMYCPHCLATDLKPYYRLSWRLSLFPLCTVHGTILQDRCSECGSPVAFHRSNFLSCHICGVDRRCAPATAAGSRALQLQYANEKVLLGQPVYVPYLVGMHPILWFRLMRHLSKVLLSGSRRAKFLAVLERYSGIEVRPDPRVRAELRFVQPGVSAQVLEAISFLLSGWPWTFIAIAEEARLFWSWAIRDEEFDDVPYAYYCPVRSLLYYSDPNEIASNERRLTVR